MYVNFTNSNKNVRQIYVNSTVIDKIKKQPVSAAQLAIILKS